MNLLNFAYGVNIAVIIESTRTDYELSEWQLISNQICKSSTLLKSKRASPRFSNCSKDKASICSSFFSCLDLELLACFYVANRFLGVSQLDYLQEVVSRGGLKLYVREVRRTELYKFLTEFLTPEEQDYFFVRILIDKLKEEQNNESVNSSAAA